MTWGGGPGHVSRGSTHVSHLRGRHHVRQHVLPAHAAPRVLAGVQGRALGADRRPEHGEGVPALVAEWVVEPDHASSSIISVSDSKTSILAEIHLNSNT